jgi:hypothetical protein
LSIRRRASAGFVAVALIAGVQAAVARPVSVQANGATPGIITNYAGGGIGEGLGTTIGQQPWGLAVTGSTLYVADWSGQLVRALDTVTGN